MSNSAILLRHSTSIVVPSISLSLFLYPRFHCSVLLLSRYFTLPSSSSPLRFAFHKLPLSQIAFLIRVIVILAAAAVVVVGSFIAISANQSRNYWRNRLTQFVCRFDDFVNWYYDSVYRIVYIVLIGDAIGTKEDLVFRLLKAIARCGYIHFIDIDVGTISSNTLLYSVIICRVIVSHHGYSLAVNHCISLDLEYGILDLLFIFLLSINDANQLWQHSTTRCSR